MESPKQLLFLNFSCNALKQIDHGIRLFMIKRIILYLYSLHFHTNYWSVIWFGSLTFEQHGSYNNKRLFSCIYAGYIFFLYVFFLSPNSMILIEHPLFKYRCLTDFQSENSVLYCHRFSSHWSAGIPLLFWCTLERSK